MQVNEDDVRRAPPKLCARGPQRIGRCDAVALAHQHPREHLAGVGIVIDDEGMSHWRRRRAAAAARGSTRPCALGYPVISGISTGPRLRAVGLQLCGGVTLTAFCPLFPPGTLAASCAARCRSASLVAKPLSCTTPFSVSTEIRVAATVLSSANLLFTRAVIVASST